MLTYSLSPSLSLSLPLSSHAAVMEKQRQTAAASDKLKRERWKSEETRRIKEATVKSLEPEIQRIIAKGKAEIQKLKAFHEVRQNIILPVNIQ